MQFRWWNSFNLLAVILLAIGVAGAIIGPRMTFDPGRQASGYEWILYVVAGALMLLNGFLPPANPDGEDEDQPPAAVAAKAVAAPAEQSAASD